MCLTGFDLCPIMREVMVGNCSSQGGGGFSVGKTMSECVCVVHPTSAVLQMSTFQSRHSCAYVIRKEDWQWEVGDTLLLSATSSSYLCLDC